MTLKTAKPLTSAQTKTLNLIRQEGAERRCFKSQSPRTTTFKWHWVSTRAGEPISEKSLRALIDRGHVHIIKGALPEQYKDLHPLEIAMRNLRAPDQAVATKLEAT